MSRVSKLVSSYSKMDLEYFVNNYSQDLHLGRAICLYIIASKNLATAFQQQNFCRCGVAGSREQANIDRSVTASGAESRASSLYSRAAMYLANSIAGMNIIAVLKLPPSVVNAPSGPTITRVLQQRRQGDNRPDYALQGKTMAVALESIYHMNLDDMPGVSRARTARQEWFKSQDAKFSKVKLALQAVGQGEYFDLSKYGNVMPDALVGKGVKLEGGQVLDTTTHRFRESPRLKPNEKGEVRLTAAEIAEIRGGTDRGQELLDEITRLEQGGAPKPTQTTTGTQTTTVRMTRSQVRALRDAQTDEEEKRRRRVARALAQLS